MQNEDFDMKAIFNRIYKACGVENDNQLSQFLEVKPSTIQSWKSAKHPPFKACYEVYRRTQNPLEWLIEGEGSGYFPVSQDGEENPAENVIRIPEEEFIDGFVDIISLGAMMDLFSVGNDVTENDIRRLGTMFYRSLNNTDPTIKRFRRKKKQC